MLGEASNHVWPTHFLEPPCPDFFLSDACLKRFVSDFVLA